MAKKTTAPTTETPNDRESKRAALDAAMNTIKKQYGQGAVMMMDDESVQNIEALSTGALTLDIALGIGGLPRGRIVEIYGPEGAGKSTLALHCVAEAQKAGGFAAYIDVEHAMDAEYARNIGVKIEETIIAQPESGEQALDIAETIIRSNAVDIVVVDSVAALVPQQEIDGEMSDMQVGAQARLMSKAMRKLTAAIKSSGTVCIFINQLREKVGVIYGCLHGDTVIPFVDGRTIPIRRVVEEQITGNVWSFNEDTAQFEQKPIIDWHYNGDVSDEHDYIHIETCAMDTSNGTCGVTVTPDHRLMTSNGWKEARNISMADEIATRYSSIVNGTIADFFYGVAVGDSHIGIRSKNTAVLRLADKNNPDYVQWKLDKLSPAFRFSQNAHGTYVSSPTSELAIIKRLIGERNPLVLLKDHYSPMGLAVWYMDDGHLDSSSHHRAMFSVKRFKQNQAMLQSICDAFGALGMECRYTLSNGLITLTSAATTHLFDIIAKFVPACMQYKLDEEHKGQYVDFVLHTEEIPKTTFVAVRSIRYASPRQMRIRGKYDISVEGNHNYLAGNSANGILVHNSPETQPGGRALKFYSSVRLDIRKQDIIKEGNTIIGNKVKVKVAKNKVAPPFKEAHFDILFGKGVDHLGEILDIGVSFDIIQKAGAFYSYNGERLGQGRDNAKKFLSEHPELMEELNAKVRDALFKHTPPTTPVEEDDDLFDVEDE